MYYIIVNRPRTCDYYPTDFSKCKHNLAILSFLNSFFIIYVIIKVIIIIIIITVILMKIII